MQVATNILKKAELLKEEEDEFAVQLWTKKGSSKLNFGITETVQSGAYEAWE